MKKIKKELFIRFRIDAAEKKRLDKISDLTRRQISDLYRDALYNFIKTNYPEVIEG